MSKFFTSTGYQAPDTIVDGASNYIEGADINDGYTKSDGINDVLTLLGGLNNLGIVTTNTTLAANEDVVVYVNATSGNITITLPAASTQKFSIIIKKVDSTTNTVTIARAGSDTIESATSPNITPAATSLVLRTPDESVELLPASSSWRVVSWYKDLSRFSASVYNNTLQNLTGGGATTELVLDAENYDYFSLFNNTNATTSVTIAGTSYTNQKYGFMVPFNGTLRIDGLVGNFGSAGARDFTVRVYKNNVNLTEVISFPQITNSKDVTIPFNFTAKVTLGESYNLFVNSSANSNIRTTITTVNFRMLDMQN